MWGIRRRDGISSWRNTCNRGELFLLTSTYTGTFQTVCIEACSDPASTALTHCSKTTFSIVLLAVVDAKHCISVVISSYRRPSDGGTLAKLHLCSVIYQWHSPTPWRWPASRSITCGTSAPWVCGRKSHFLSAGTSGDLFQESGSLQGAESSSTCCLAQEW